jgi:hypothetical protein
MDELEAASVEAERGAGPMCGRGGAPLASAHEDALLSQLAAKVRAASVHAANAAHDARTTAQLAADARSAADAAAMVEAAELPPPDVRAAPGAAPPTLASNPMEAASSSGSISGDGNSGVRNSSMSRSGSGNFNIFSSGNGRSNASGSSSSGSGSTTTTPTPSASSTSPQALPGAPLSPPSPGLRARRLLVRISMDGAITVQVVASAPDSSVTEGGPVRRPLWRAALNGLALALDSSSEVGNTLTLKQLMEGEGGESGGQLVVCSSGND